MDETHELLAIVGIVVFCLVMFLTWLMSMALCPDTMVNILSGKGRNGGGSSGSGASYRESRELIRKSDESMDAAEAGRAGAAAAAAPRAASAADAEAAGVRSVSGCADYDQGSADLLEDASLVRSVSAVLAMTQARKLSEKKLSVVDEVDEQLTLQSTIHSGGRPSILKHPVTQVVVETHAEPVGDDV